MTLLYFVLAALALGVLVFFHELGHYLAAKKMGMNVEIFSIGFGRPLLKWRWNQVDWQLGWLPFGGYVKIAGMEFGKKDKNQYTEPYEIPNGFFSKSPSKRIMVALAGPVANFLLAFLFFSAIWLMGGREKPFADFTQIVGWVDPRSEVYKEGLRPGDIITHYNGKKYTGPKDLIYATLLSGERIRLNGYRVDYDTGEKKPFSYMVNAYQASNSLNGILTTGITSGARYLIYDKFPGGQPNTMPEGSPMEQSGIHYGDRLVSADGELLFSMDQLSHALNANHALVTIMRDGKIFTVRQPRVKAGDLVMPSHVRNELVDWQYEARIRGRWQDLILLPFVINTEGYIEAPLNFIDQESKREAFPEHLFSEKLDAPLQARDRILAVDGVKVKDGVRILELLQNHRVLLIAQKNVPASTKVSWKEEDKVFQNSLHLENIHAILNSLGTEHPITESGDMRLLNPVIPKKMDQFVLSSESKAELNAQYEKQRGEIEGLKDQEKRATAIRHLEKNQEKLLLGIFLQDRTVTYNPSPFAMFGNVLKETGQTLKALVTGYLNPKWISGPVGIVQVIQHGWKVGIGEALFWIGAISLNLAVLNLLPIPVLDGGYICLSLWELITKRRLKAKTMERLIIPFVVLLIAFLVFLTFQDISRFFS